MRIVNEKPIYIISPGSYFFMVAVLIMLGVVGRMLSDENLPFGRFLLLVGLVERSNAEILAA